MEKSKLETLQKEIRKILLRDWDPIGIRDEEYAQDEYDLYIDHIISLLINVGTYEELLNFLEFVILERMELPLSENLKCANKLTVRNILKLAPPPSVKQ